MQISLVMVNAAGEAREIPVRQLPAAVGRGEHCRVRIPLAAISRHHCDLVIVDEELMVRDAGSSNGTYVNGERIRERELIPGDLLAVGPVVFVVRIDGHPKEIDAKDSYAAGTIGMEGSQNGVPGWGAGAGQGGSAEGPTKIEPLVGGAGADDPDDSDFDFDLDLSGLDDDEK